MGERLLREIGCAALRANRSMRDELLNGGIFYTLAEAQILIEAWRRHNNTVRPHSSLRYHPPAPETAHRHPALTISTDHSVGAGHGHVAAGRIGVAERRASSHQPRIAIHMTLRGPTRLLPQPHRAQLSLHSKRRRVRPP